MKKVLFGLCGVTLIALCFCMSFNVLNHEQSVRFPELDSNAFVNILYRRNYEAIDGVKIYEDDEYIYQRRSRHSYEMLDDLECVKYAEEISSQQNAVDFANAIIDECHQKGQYIDYKLKHVLHLSVENIWMFEYWKTLPTKPYASVEGGGLMVVIDGNTGELVEAYLEE